MRQWNVWVTAEATFEWFLSTFLQKAHVTSIPSVEFFWGGPKKFLPPQIGRFFRGTDTFPEMRGPSQNWGAGGWPLWSSNTTRLLEKCSGLVISQPLNFGKGPSILGKGPLNSGKRTPLSRKQPIFGLKTPGTNTKFFSQFPNIYGWMDGWMRTSVRGFNPSLRNIHWPLLPPPSHLAALWAE